MKRMIILLMLLLFVTSLIAQTRSQRDSLYRYRRELSQMMRNAFDSVRNSTEFISITEKAKDILRRSNRYNGVALYVDIAHANYSAFNKELAQAGFEPLKEILWRFGIGYCNKKNHVLFDINFFTLGQNNKSKMGDEKVKTSFSNLLQFDLGYDVLNSQSVSVYPYAGLSLRFSSLDYSKPVQTNSNYTDFRDIKINDQSFTSSSSGVGYQAGIGIDVVIGRYREDFARTILFTKIGTNQRIGEEKYEIEGVDYKPGIRQGDWLITIGFKFVSRD